MSTTDTPIRELLRHQLTTEIAPQFRAGVPLDQQRQVLDGMGAAAELPEGLSVHRGHLAGRETEWLLGPGCSPEHTLLHLHGGGYVMGSCASHRAMAARIGIACGAQVVLPEYRLAPEHAFPAALEDAVMAYGALLARGLPAKRIVLVGDSAGGGLTLATLVALRDAGAPMPAAAVLLSPWTDLTFSGESLRTRLDVDPWLDTSLLAPFSEAYRGDVAADDPRVSPLFADLGGLPPLLVHVGDHEILLSDAMRLALRASAAGVQVDLEVWPELWHVWHLFAPVLPEANQAMAKIGRFVRGKLATA